MSLALPADVVVIELPAEHPSASSAAVASCELVLGEGRCRAREQAGPDATWIARVSWDTPSRRALVVVRRTDDDRGVESTRQVEFAAEDPLEQRYRALGLLIVAEVVAAGYLRTDESAADSATPARAPEPRRWGFDVGGFGGPGLSEGPARFGAFARGWFRPTSLGVTPLAGLGWGVRPGQPDALWLTGSLGLALRWEGALPVHAETRVEALIQRVELEAESQALGSERAEVLQLGARLALEGHWQLSDHVGLLVGFEASALRPELIVEVEQQSRGRDPVPTWSILSGVRVAP